MNKFVTESPPKTLDERSKYLRRLVIKTLAHSRRGHLGPAFSLIEILRVLYDSVLSYDPNNPYWPVRDRCVLSKGHGCLALYALLADKGFISMQELWSFCQADSRLGGHPEQGKIPGIEATTGSLGHGLSIGIGFAINARIESLPYRTFVIIGDGESNEGSIWEAALCASKHELSNLSVIIDYNKYQSYGAVSEVQNLEPLAMKWQSFGFNVTEVDGHGVEVLDHAFNAAPNDAMKPNAIICHTIKGKGIDFVENNLNWHHKSNITDEMIQQLYSGLN